jgi:Flp pilus assembly protein TadG
MRKLLRKFDRDRCGNVSIIAALALPLLLGFIALAAEFGHGLLVKTENQRIADLAAYAGALAYSSSSSTTTMTAVAQNVAALNGVAAAQTTVSLVTSPRTSTDSAVSVKIAKSNMLLLAPVLHYGTSLPVNATAYAEVEATPVSSCILANSTSGTGITLSGGTSVSAPNCNVSSNNTISVPCGDTITAKAVTYNSTAVPSQPCTGISGTISKTKTADPLSGNTGVTALSAIATALSSLTSPSAPSAPTVSSGTSASFAYSGTPTLPSGCSAALASSTWTMTCASGKTYNFGTITLGGGLVFNVVTTGSSATTYNFSGAFSFGGTVTVNTSSSATITYNFAQGIALTYGTMTFGAGTFNIGGGIVNSGGGVMTFGAGTFNVVNGITNSSGTLTFGAGTFTLGAATTGSCWAGAFSICNLSGTLTIPGPTTFALSSGIYNAGGATLFMGCSSASNCSTTNSFNIGAASTGDAIQVGGGSTTVFGGATGSSALFQFDGNFNAASGGGSCMTLGAATQHSIKGNFSTAGGNILGSGIYAVYGYIAFGASGGGDVTCSGSTVGVSGSSVNFVTAGATSLTSSPCTNMVFCVGSGYSNVTLTAPTSGTYANLLFIGPISSSNTYGTVFTEGASNTSLSGTFYFPYGPLTLSGGASVGNVSGQCLQIIASQITLSGGTKITSSSCFSSSSSSSTVELVQ